MPGIKSSIAGRRRRHNPLILHRKNSQFKDLLRLVRESHARVAMRKTGEG